MHPLLKVRELFREILLEMGFNEMPTDKFVERSFWNFDTLFQPQSHPARDMHDTFFIKNPENKGKLMMSGLWAYTRHPNYFGEVTLWWGLWIVSISALSNTSLLFAIISLVGPLTITFLILKVSGIPMLEKKMEENPDFAEYKKRVSKFIPLLPKNN